ncbi:hypothetical protein Cgig2_006399 [Carnegiea gigantea]|uniref:Uncharacterized protein n=1 Tax=Carnegiea gigantea TaxID=171969 RepID=A0A9Q1QE31_9CARY|nr:hypothetical protein Cgig2_006399 [Carnegiea gigantea]
MMNPIGGNLTIVEISIEIDPIGTLPLEETKAILGTKDMTILIIYDVARKVKADVPDLDGKYDPNAFVDWLDRLEDYEFHRVCFAKMKLVDSTNQGESKPFKAVTFQETSYSKGQAQSNKFAMNDTHPSQTINVGKGSSFTSLLVHSSSSPIVCHKCEEDE